jgi:1,4-alpha-glucan branching enzyme
MKKTRNEKRAPRKSARTEARTTTAHFEYVNPTAISVCVAGSFNEWHPQLTEMLRGEEGRWTKEVALAPGVYEYLFVVDGEWTPDPAALASTANPYGGRNSVIMVPEADAGD